jgi:hypothetical protein
MHPVHGHQGARHCKKQELLKRSEQWHRRRASARTPRGTSPGAARRRAGPGTAERSARPTTPSRPSDGSITDEDPRQAHALGEPGSPQVLGDVLPQRGSSAPTTGILTSPASERRRRGLQRSSGGGGRRHRLTNQEAINLRAAHACVSRASSPTSPSSRRAAKGKFVAAIPEAEQARVADNMDGWSYLGVPVNRPGS